MMTADPIAASTVPRRIAALPDPLIIGPVGAGPLNEWAAQYLVDMHAFESARFSACVHDMIEALVMYAHGDWAWTDEPLLRDKPIPGLCLSYRDLSLRLAQWGRANVAPDLWVRATELAQAFIWGDGVAVATPHIDSLAKRGALCDRFYAASPVCTPSRASFVSGRYPQNTGAHVNDVPIRDDVVTFAEVLRRNGYTTRYAGKWHVDGPARPGW